MDNQKLEEAKNGLINMGFTQLESDIYLYLLQHGRSTGYAIAKAIGKATANTYKGIESLKLKGAIEVSMGKSKQCKALPWKLFLENHQNSYQRNITQLSDALTQLPEHSSDEAVYQLENAEQVITQSRYLIDSAQEIILADIDPSALPLFKAALEAAAARGIEVRVKIYEPAKIEGAHIVLREQGKQVYHRTKDSNFKICVDGKETMLALFDSAMEELIQAFKTQSPLMNMDLYCGLLYELILTDLKQLIAKDDFVGAKLVLEQTKHLHPYSADGPPLKHFIKEYKTEN